jgi:hypothetical protein
MAPRYEIMKHSWRFSLLSFLCLLLVACAAASNEAGEAEVQQVGEPRRLLCADECRQRGQCGLNQDQQLVVLGHRESPHITDHNVFFPDGQEVGMLEIQPRQLQTVLGREPLSVHFYRVTTPDNSRTGWVAGWCVDEP